MGRDVIRSQRRSHRSAQSVAHRRCGARMALKVGLSPRCARAEVGWRAHCCAGRPASPEHQAGRDMSPRTRPRVPTRIRWGGPDRTWHTTLWHAQPHSRRTPKAIRHKPSALRFQIFRCQCSISPRIAAPLSSRSGMWHERASPWLVVRPWTPLAVVLYKI
jgi:hypothetical protein